MMFWANIFLLMIIHTLDMLLTWHYIGDVWGDEMFFPMAVCIKYFGIHNALWISRANMYTIFFFMITYRENKHVQTLTLLINVLYWTAMTTWLFTLHILRWPS